MRFEPPTYDRIPSIDAMVVHLDRTVTGLDATKRRLALMLRRFMVSAVRDHDRPPQNVVVISPSGTGKTFLLRQLLEICPVVWTEANATEYSDVGYFGRDLVSMYLGLLGPRWRGWRGDADAPWTQQEMVSHAQRWGVVIVDEMDKLRAPSRPKEGERQVGRALQAELLKLVEGTEALVKRSDDDRGVLFSTHNVLHIAVGAFQGIGDIVAREMRQQGMEPPPNAYTKTSIHNLCDYGFLEELIGRFSTVVTLPPLDAGHMARILREHVIPEFQRQCADDGITLEVDEGAIMAASSKAAGLPIGARALAPMIDDCLAVNWAQAHSGDVLRLDAESIHHDSSLLVRPVAA